VADCGIVQLSIHEEKRFQKVNEGKNLSTGRPGDTAVVTAGEGRSRRQLRSAAAAREWQFYDPRFRLDKPA
jgi:hypothetical protein